MAGLFPLYKVDFHKDGLREFKDDFLSQLYEDIQTQLKEVKKLGFCQLCDWEENRAYIKYLAIYIYIT